MTALLLLVFGKDVFVEIVWIGFRAVFGVGEGIVDGGLNPIANALQGVFVRQVLLQQIGLKALNGIPSQPGFFLGLRPEFVGVGQGMTPEPIGQALNQSGAFSGRARAMASWATVRTAINLSIPSTSIPGMSKEAALR